MIESLPRSPSKPIVLSIGERGQHSRCDRVRDTQGERESDVQHIQLNSGTISSDVDGACKVESVSDDIFAKQFKTATDSKIDVIEIGLLASTFQVNLLAEFLEARKIFAVYCPIHLAISHNSIEVVNVIRQKLLSLCNLVLLNKQAPEWLLIVEDGSNAPILEGANCLLDLGVKGVLITDAKCRDSEYYTDHFFESTTSFRLLSPRVELSRHRLTDHGLALTLAKLIAQGHFFHDAIVKGITERNRLYRLASTAENEPSTLNQSTDDQQCDIPLLLSTSSVAKSRETSFPSISENALGLYPVVDRASWLERLLPLGVSTIQLRVKDLQGEALKLEIAKAVDIAQQYDCRLFINDYWELAIECGAYGVHLGQEDIENANLTRILDAGLRLGLSSHCHYEVARCLAIKPSYIAIGPVFPTTTKIMPWTTHGIEGLKYWQTTLDYPLVAIAGIKPANFAEVVATGVSGVAMITAITESSQPELTCQIFLDEMNN